MIRPADALAAFEQAGVSFWTGVPDSLLADFCRCVERHVPANAHVIAANEGGAVAIAAGHYLATEQVAGVYLQNSGLGNAINPLVSLVDPVVYGIPVVLLIGWRGEPGTLDEPQHVRQGETTLAMLGAIGVPARTVAASTETFSRDVDWAVAEARRRSGPTALVVRAGSFEAYVESNAHVVGGSLQREAALFAVTDALPADVAIVSTTGKTSRELYELRKKAGAGEGDFLMIGSMGHASQIALAIALGQPARRVCVLDGDGALIMHLGSLAVIGEHAPRNLFHVLLNNCAHESVGGQPTPSRNVDFPGLARAAGYSCAERVERLDDVSGAVARLIGDKGPAFLEILIAQGSRPDLGRPEETPVESRNRFMAWLRG